VRHAKAVWSGALSVAALWCMNIFAADGRTPQAPVVLQPPSGDVLRLSLMGKGVQIYQCTASSDSPSHFEWKFQAPEAQLLDSKGHVIGKHFAGPTWEAADGSSVVGEVKARDDGPDASAIPWLLLTAKSVSGSGIFGKVHSIQRLNTSGGKAPAESCGAANANQVVRVPYSANYYFYAGS
jgi:hypothetical protein